MTEVINRAQTVARVACDMGDDLFATFAVWGDGDSLYWATDLNCSCCSPTPFANLDERDLRSSVDAIDAYDALQAWVADMEAFLQRGISQELEQRIVDAEVAILDWDGSGGFDCE